MRDATWDSLEAAVLQKLFKTVQSSAVSLTIAEMLAIANVANKAKRGNRDVSKEPPPGTQITTNIGFFPGNPAAGILPAGDLGTIKMSLSHRVQKQIEGQAQTLPPRLAPKAIDSMEMLSLNEIQNAESAFTKENGK